MYTIKMVLKRGRLKKEKWSLCRVQQKRSDFPLTQKKGNKLNKIKPVPSDIHDNNYMNSKRKMYIFILNIWKVHFLFFQLLKIKMHIGNHGNGYKKPSIFHTIHESFFCRANTLINIRREVVDVQLRSLILWGAKFSSRYPIGVFSRMMNSVMVGTS